MANSIDDTNIQREYIEHIVALFVGFERFIYQNVDQLKDLKWDPDPDKTRIVISGEFQDNEMIYKPNIVVSRGDVGWANLSFDPYKNVGVQTSLGIDNIATRKMDLITGLLRIDHFSEKSYESSALAWLSFILIQTNKKQFQTNGLQYVGTVTLAPTIAIKKNYHNTTVLVKWQAKVEWIYEKIVDSLTKWTIILEDTDTQKVWNEIELTFT